MATALARGDVDAISAVEPFLTAAEGNLGANVILPQCQGATADLPLSGYFATAAWVAKYPATARAFAAAIDKAQALADADRAAVERILPTYIKISKTTAALVDLNSYPTSLDAVQIQRVADLMDEGRAAARGRPAAVALTARITRAGSGQPRVVTFKGKIIDRHRRRHGGARGPARGDLGSDHRPMAVRRAAHAGTARLRRPSGRRAAERQ